MGERDKELAGIEMDRVFATSRTHLRKREVASITLLLSRFNLCMMMMKFM